jgi:hypothetical protein
MSPDILTLSQITLQAFNEIERLRKVLPLNTSLIGLTKEEYDFEPLYGIMELNRTETFFCTKKGLPGCIKFTKFLDLNTGNI